MRRSGHILFSIFFAVLTALVLGLVVTTALPVDTEEYGTDAYEQLSLWRMVLSLGLSTIALVAGLAIPLRFEVFRIGLLLGALITLVVANVWAWGYENDLIRLAAALVSLVLAGIAGWWQFNPRRSRPADGPAPHTAPARAVSTTTTQATEGPITSPGTVEARIEALESRLDQTAAALRGDTPLK